MSENGDDLPNDPLALGRGDEDADDDAPDNGRGVFEPGTLRPDRYPSKKHSTWIQWKQHFLWLADTNGWDDITAIRALPTCLTPWALDKFTAMPARFTRQVGRNLPPTLARVFEYLDPRMSPYRDQRTARAEFKALMQSDKEETREFSRRVRALGDIAHTHMNALSLDDMNREQFIDGLFDPDIYELLLREDPQTFDEAVNRALSLEAIKKGSRFRQRKRISAIRTMAEATSSPPVVAQPLPSQASRGVQGTSIAQMPLTNDALGTKIDKLVDSQEKFMSNISSMMSRFVSSVIPGPPAEQAHAPQYTGKQLFNPYPPDSRYGQGFASASRPQGQYNPGQQRRQGGTGCFYCGSSDHFKRECPLLANSPLN